MSSYFSPPFPFFWAVAAAFVVLAWYLTKDSKPRTKANLRAFVFALSVSPALILAAGHSGVGYALFPLLSLVMLSLMMSPIYLLFAAINLVQFFALWAVLAYFLRSVYCSSKEHPDAIK